MKFEDYLKQCLKNPEFRRYWEEDNELVNKSVKNKQEGKTKDRKEKNYPFNEENL